MFFLTNLLQYFYFFTNIESEKSIVKLSRMTQPCDNIRIATENETKQTRHHRTLSVLYSQIQL